MNELSFNEFKEKIVNEFKKNVPNVEVSVKDVNKGNGVSLVGMIVSGDSNISPTIYLDYYYYDYYLKGIYDFNQCLDALINSYNKNKVKDNIDITAIMSKEYVLSHVYPCVVNYNMNAEGFIKNDIVFADQGELALCYRVMVNDKAVNPLCDDGLQTFLLKETHLEMTGITYDELNKAALKNLKDMTETQNLSDILRNALGDDFLMDMVDSEDVVPMYVVSNKYKTLGASGGFIDKENLDGFCDKFDTDVISIIPSSIHEVIVISEYDELSYMNNMIKEVNSSELEKTDILSNNVFQYNKELNQIYCIDNNNYKTICFEFDDNNVPIINNDMGRQRTI